MRIQSFLKFLFVMIVFTQSNILIAQSDLPTTQIKSLDGKSVTLKDYIKEGKVTVISFWATWCAPCKKELDAINEVYADWQKDYGVELIAISTDDSRSSSKIRPMVEQKGWEYTVLSDPNQELQKAFNFQAVPQTFLVDQSGKIVWTHSGYVPGDENELEAKIKELTKK